MHYREQIQQWLTKLRTGTLAEADLLQALDSMEAQVQSRQQRLLYLQTSTTGIDSEVLGMALAENGQILDGPEDPDEWPYHSVLAAIQDGWRIIKFPEMALLLQEDKTFGLGCEFILEKMI